MSKTKKKTSEPGCLTTLLGYIILASLIALIVDTVRNKMTSKTIHNIKVAAIVISILFAIYIAFKIYKRFFTKQLDSTNGNKSGHNLFSSFFKIFHSKKKAQNTETAVQKDIETSILENNITQTEQQYTYNSKKENLVKHKHKEEEELLKFAKCASQIANLESLKELTINHCKEQYDYILWFYNKIKDFDLLIIQMDLSFQRNNVIYTTELFGNTTISKIRRAKGELIDYLNVSDVKFELTSNSERTINIIVPLPISISNLYFNTGVWIDNIVITGDKHIHDTNQVQEKCFCCKSYSPLNGTYICQSCREKYNLSASENEFINNFLDISFSEYSENERAICISSSTEPVTGNCRNFLNDLIINQYGKSNHPLDILAVAMTYARMHAVHRPLAILFFEKFRQSPVEIPKIYRFAYSQGKISDGRDAYSKWSIFSKFAKIYEAEKQYHEAILCLQKCIEINNGTNPTDFERLEKVKIKLHK